MDGRFASAKYCNLSSVIYVKDSGQSVEICWTIIRYFNADKRLIVTDKKRIDAAD